MIDQQFLSVNTGHNRTGSRRDVFGPLHGGERVLWRGHAGVAEYAFEQPASLPRWTLPETTEVMVTDQRVRYAHTSSDSPDDVEITSGELRWLWPQHLRVQPGPRETGRPGATTQIQLVCGGSDGSWPALVFAGGDLRTVAEADRLANVLRQAIARFRVDNATKLGLATAQSRLLSRLLIGPEFSNYQGGPGETVSLPGALLVVRATPVTEPEPVYPPSGSPVEAAMSAPTPAPVSPAVSHRAEEYAVSHRAEQYPADAGMPHAGPARRPVGEGATRVLNSRPGLAADMARALQAAKAEEATQQAEPDLASRAADLAARVASLVSGSPRLTDDQVTAALDRPSPDPPEPRRPTPSVRVDLSGADRFEVSTTNLAERAEILRRTAARFTANSARNKAAARRPADADAQIRGNRPS